MRSWMIIGVVIASGCADGQVLFRDNFDGGSSPLWMNQRGGWVASGGVYFASAPSNSPTTLTSLPLDLGDFTIDVDIQAVSDGGIYMHTDEQANNGVLLVTGGELQTGRGLYWHVISGGSFSPSLNPSGTRFVQGQDIHLTVTARGATYAAFIDGVLATTITIEHQRTGSVGLYDFADLAQAFDNVVVRGTCPGDFNVDGGVDGSDVDAFFTSWEAGDVYADFNEDGGVDGADVEAFFAAWEGGC